MGKLIKAKGRIIPREVMSARDQAAAMLAAANEQADFLNARAIEAAEEARLRAHAEGLEAGKQEAAAETSELLVRAHQEADEILVAAREGAIPLARRMAERIVGRALELHPSLVADIANQALQASRARSGPVTLRIHPSDMHLLEVARPRLTSRLPTAVELKLVADEMIAPGGCVIETSVGRLDAQLSKQLDALERALGERAGGQKS